MSFLLHHDRLQCHSCWRQFAFHPSSSNWMLQEICQPMKVSSPLYTSWQQLSRACNGWGAHCIVMGFHVASSHQLKLTMWEIRWPMNFSSPCFLTHDIVTGFNVALNSLHHNRFPSLIWWNIVEASSRCGCCFCSQFAGGFPWGWILDGDGIAYRQHRKINVVGSQDGVQ